jgi:hypothetical protein
MWQPWGNTRTPGGTERGPSDLAGGVQVQLAAVEVTDRVLGHLQEQLGALANGVNKPVLVLERVREALSKRARGR